MQIAHLQDENEFLRGHVVILADAAVEMQKVTVMGHSKTIPNKFANGICQPNNVLKDEEKFWWGTMAPVKYIELDLGKVTCLKEVCLKGTARKNDLKDFA